MGRTKRRRKHKSSSLSNQYLNANTTVINLCKWMGRNHWSNDTHLRLKEFPQTGRGLSSKYNFVANDALIKIPFSLMISFNTLASCSDFVNIFRLDIEPKPLKIHDMLALFLLIEAHKKEKSFWFHYIETLPKCLPDLPWLLPDDINLPSDIKTLALSQRTNFLGAWSKITQSIRPDWLCNCCETSYDRVITMDSFRHYYVLVNTRAVYINPSLILNLNTTLLLSDEPSMALCPFLDMFNHSTRAETDASLDNSLTFRLVTLTPYKKHQQVFISYGPHDNDALLCEYGFVVERNEFDCVRFTVKDILSVLGKDCKKSQINYVKSLEVGGLSVSLMHVSFNLKQVLYVLLRPNVGVNVWNATTFSETYNEGDLKVIYVAVRSLLESRRKVLNIELAALEGIAKCSLLCSFLKYKIKYCGLCYDSLE